MLRKLILVLALLLTAPVLAGAPAFGRSMETGDAIVARQATPAVVNIAVWKLRPPSKPGDSPRRVKAYGSGFIIDPAGIIVTNKHVIDGALDIKVIFSDGSRTSAKLLSAAAMIDLAVVKVEVGRPLPALKWGRQRGPARGRRRARDRQSARDRPVGLGRDRQRAEPRHPGHAVRQLHTDRRGDQSRQFGRAADGHGRRSHRRGHGALQSRRGGAASSASASRSPPRPRNSSSSTCSIPATRSPAGSASSCRT